MTKFSQRDHFRLLSSHHVQKGPAFPPHRATHYVVKVELGGVAGIVAPLIGKQPQDTHVWILGGKAPAFVKMEGPLYQGAAIWRIELTSPVLQLCRYPAVLRVAGYESAGLFIHPT